jgi:hypothetical protein
MRIARVAVVALVAVLAAATAAGAASARSHGKHPAAAPTGSATVWDGAGALLWHPTAVDPAQFGATLRAAGFGWAAVYFGEAGVAHPPSTEWIARFRQASGLPVGGWTVLGDDPAADAAVATQGIAQYGFSFYIADAESTDPAQPQRSADFVAAFRAAEPTLPAALSSLCHADGVGLAPWAQAGFAFLPQAYVNDFGVGVSPSACVQAAAPWFPRSQVHPTVASYKGQLGTTKARHFAKLLKQAGTTGFSIFPAEAGMTAKSWQAYGQAIAKMHIAVAG